MRSSTASFEHPVTKAGVASIIERDAAGAAPLHGGPDDMVTTFALMLMAMAAQPVSGTIPQRPDLPTGAERQRRAAIKAAADALLPPAARSAF